MKKIYKLTVDAVADIIQDYINKTENENISVSEVCLIRDHDTEVDYLLAEVENE